MRWLVSKNESLANAVAMFPWSKVFYTITIGYALHLIVLYPSLCSKFMHKISDMVLSYRYKIWCSAQTLNVDIQNDNIYGIFQVQRHTKTYI